MSQRWGTIRTVLGSFPKVSSTSSVHYSSPSFSKQNQKLVGILALSILISSSFIFNYGVQESWAATPSSVVVIDNTTTNVPTLDSGGQFGASVANIGDLDGDGVEDRAPALACPLFQTA